MARSFVDEYYACRKGGVVGSPDLGKIAPVIFEHNAQRCVGIDGKASGMQVAFRVITR